MYSSYCASVTRCNCILNVCDSMIYFNKHKTLEIHISYSPPKESARVKAATTLREAIHLRHQRPVSPHPRPP